MTLTERLAGYVLGRTPDRISPEIRSKAKLFLMDSIGCAIAGADERPVRIVRASLAGMAREGTATLIASAGEGTAALIASSGEGTAPLVASSGEGTATLIASGGERIGAEGAAQVNGTAAHIHDFDDGTTAMRGHPSAVIMPAALAVGEELHAGGGEVLAAYIAGVEVCGLLGRGLNPAHYTRGWHNTGTIGVFGAAAAAGRLFGLDRRQLAHAFGIAASESSGLKGNFGTMTKSLHAGRAAAKGIMAARLAALGFESSLEILEEGHGNFPDVTTGGMDRDRIRELLRTAPSCFETPGLDFKVYPSCGATHNGIDAVYALKREQGLTAGNVRNILCRVQPVTRDLLRYREPVRPLEGKFSMQYCLALALLRDEITLEDFEGERISDPEVIGLMGKIRMVTDETIAKGEYFRKDYRWDVIVEAETNTGEKFVKRVEYAQGDPHLGTDPLLMERKFLRCVERGMSQEQAATLLQRIRGVDSLSDIHILAEAAGRRR